MLSEADCLRDYWKLVWSKMVHTLFVLLECLGFYSPGKDVPTLTTNHKLQRSVLADLLTIPKEAQENYHSNQSLGAEVELVRL